MATGQEFPTISRQKKAVDWRANPHGLWESEDTVPLRSVDDVE